MGNQICTTEKDNQISPKTKYFCPRCKVFFFGVDFQAYRQMTGNFLSHRCGEVACLTSEGDFYHQKYPNAIVEGRKLVNDWCGCENSSETAIFKDDGECSCGCVKHHYHCDKCGKIAQVG